MYTCTIAIILFLQSLASHGKAGFYEGQVAEAIVACLKENGGAMTLDDLRTHRSTFDEPIRTRYRDIDVWEIPPNGQGITALVALNILEGFDFKGAAELFCNEHIVK